MSARSGCQEFPTRTFSASLSRGMGAVLLSSLSLQCRVMRRDSAEVKTLEIDSSFVSIAGAGGATYTA